MTLAQNCCVYDLSPQKLHGTKIDLLTLSLKLKNNFLVMKN